MSTLVVSGLSKRYGHVRALDGVDLTVASGTLTAVLGPSGCGKTTLLRCVAGLEHPEAGEIRINDVPVDGPGVHVPAHRRRAAIVPQEGALFPHLSVADNVGYGLSRSARRSGRVEETLELVGLAGMGNRMPHELSGGQQQRVAVARALAPRPPIVLLDEPFSALDASLRGELRRDVREALRADGATAVLVTHDQGEALSMADQVAVMRAGRIVQAGPPDRVYGEPADLWVAGFVGEAIELSAYVNGRVAHTALGDLPVSGSPALPPTGPVVAMVRPEQVEVLPREAGLGVPATVVRVDFHGHDALVALRLNDGTPLLARLFATAADHTSPTVGAEVRVRARGEARIY